MKEADDVTFSQDQWSCSLRVFLPVALLTGKLFSSAANIVVVRFSFSRGSTSVIYPMLAPTSAMGFGLN